MDPQLSDALLPFLQRLIDGRLPPTTAPLLAAATLIAIRETKSNGQEKFRPIAIGSVFRRLAGRIVTAKAAETPTVRHFLQNQLAVGVKGGIEAGVHAVRFALSRLGSDPRYVLISADLSNAFNTCSRQHFLDTVVRVAPGLARYVHYLYSEASPLFCGSSVIWSREGVQQGDPTGMLLFCLVLQDVINALNAKYDLPLNLWFADDGYLIVPVTAAADVLRTLATEAARYGLRLNLSKTRAWWPVMTHSALDSLPCAVMRDGNGTPAPGIEIFGAAIGTAEYEASVLDRRTAAVQRTLDHIAHIRHPQLAYRMQRFCASHPNIIYTLRCQPPAPLRDAASRFDDAIIAGLAAAHRLPLTHLHRASTARRLIHLPLRFAGLSLLSASQIRHAAYISSLVDTSYLVRVLVAKISGFAAPVLLTPAMHLLSSEVVDISEDSTCWLPGLLLRSEQRRRLGQPPHTQRFLLTKMYALLYNRLLPPRTPSSFPRPLRSADVDAHETQKLRAHMLQCATDDANALLMTAPSAALRTKMTPAIWRTLIQRRLRLPLFPCSTPEHPLWCPYCLAYSRHRDANPLRKRRHSELSRRRETAADAHRLDLHGDHASVCNRGSTGYTRRHNSLLRAIAFILYGGRTSEMRYTFEPPQLTGDANLRPDLLVENRTEGTGNSTNRVAIDVTFTFPYAPSKLPTTTRHPEDLLRILDREKTDKYRAVLARHHDPIAFYAFAATTAGVLSPQAHALIRDRAGQRSASSDLSERLLERIIITQVTSAIHEYVSLSINSRRPRTESPAAWPPDPGD